MAWKVIKCTPCTIRLLSVPTPSAPFHDFDEYERLVGATKATDAQAYLIVLFGGEAGLRCGEMLALQWVDVDLAKRQLRIQRSEWNGHVTVPKGGRTGMYRSRPSSRGRLASIGICAERECSAWTRAAR